MIEVLSGATLKGVPEAQVMLGGREYSTDARGMVTVLDVQAPESDVDIQAAGYLTRLTRLKQMRQKVTLWPVANDDEAQAVRRMAFNRDRARDVLPAFDTSDNFYVTLRALTPELDVAWTAAALEFSRQFGITYQIGSAFQYDQNELEVVFDRNSSNWCTPSPVLGFCRSSSPYRIFSVQPDRVTDPVTMRRVLASLFLGPDPIPGLLSPTDPEETLSPLEIQTIRMILQRPFTTRWPDDDRS